MTVYSKSIQREAVIVDDVATDAIAALGTAGQRVDSITLSRGLFRSLCPVGRYRTIDGLVTVMALEVPAIQILRVGLTEFDGQIRIETS